MLCFCGQRDAVVREFRSGHVWVLICTDVMCRGMDFKGVNLVVNYDFPNSDYVYIHRIGNLSCACRLESPDLGKLRRMCGLMLKER